LEIDQFWLGDLYAILTAVAWSFALILFRIGTFSHDTIPLKILHNTIAIAFFAITIPLFHQPLWPALSPTDWALLMMSAFLGITIGDTFHMGCLRRLGPGRTAILDCLYSPAVMFYAYAIYSEVLTGTELLGAALILSGVMVASMFKHAREVSRRDLWVGSLFGVLTQLTVALCVMMVRPILFKTSILTFTAYRFLFANMLLIVWAFVREPSWRRTFRSFQWNRQFGWDVLAGFLGPYLATVLWFLGFKYTLSGRAALLNQMSSVFILILARWILKEPLTLNKIVGLALAFCGIVILTLSRS
jgi:drug/metabolite transporter (DMT)-like permease